MLDGHRTGGNQTMQKGIQRILLLAGWMILLALIFCGCAKTPTEEKALIVYMSGTESGDQAEVDKITGRLERVKALQAAENKTDKEKTQQ